MTSSTDKERARRDGIEAVWVAPEPLVARHPTTDAERPSTASAILKTIPEDFEIEEWTVTVHDFPKWKTVTPGDTHLSYVAEPVAVYHLAAQRKPFVEGELAAVDVMYWGGAPIEVFKAVVIVDEEDDDGNPLVEHIETRSQGIQFRGATPKKARIAVGTKNGRAEWRHVPAASLAKAIRELTS